jgi:hypothetical protein
MATHQASNSKGICSLTPLKKDHNKLQSNDRNTSIMQGLLNQKENNHSKNASHPNQTLHQKTKPTMEFDKDANKYNFEFVPAVENGRKKQ